MKKLMLISAILLSVLYLSGCKIKDLGCGMAPNPDCHKYPMQKVEKIKSFSADDAGIFHQAYRITQEQGDAITNHSMANMSVKYTTSNMRLTGNSMMALEVVDPSDAVIAQQEFDTVLSSNALIFNNPMDVDNWLSSYATNTSYKFHIIVATEYQVTGNAGDVALIKGSLMYLGQSQASSSKTWVIEGQDDNDGDSGIDGPGRIQPGTGICRPGQICREEP